MTKPAHIRPFRYDGRVYDMTVNDFTAVDDRAILEEFNWRVSLTSIFGGAMSPATLAALIWRWRVASGEAGLTYEQVASTFTLDKVEFLDPDEDADDAAAVEQAPKA